MHVLNHEYRIRIQINTHHGIMVTVETNLWDSKLKDVSLKLSPGAEQYFSTVKVIQNTVQYSREIRRRWQGIPICDLNEAISVIYQVSLISKGKIN